MSKTLKVSDETYERLNKLAGHLQAREGRPASMDRAIGELLDEAERASLLDFVGSWEMSDQEAEAFERALEETWATWTIGS